VPVPFKKFNGDVGHRKGNMMSGRFPQKACKQILGVLSSAESNAKDKGLITESLFIAHICVHKAGKQMHYGRKGSRQMKRANVEIVLKENMDLKKEIEKVAKKKPVSKKQEKLTSVKKDEVKIENKKKEVKNNADKEVKSEDKSKAKEVKSEVKSEESKAKEVKAKEVISSQKLTNHDKTDDIKSKSISKKSNETPNQSPKKVKSDSKTQDKEEQ
jgi:hypothetical protein